MAINIKKQETFIPIKVGDVELKFHYSDKSMAKVRKELIKTDEEIKKATKNGETNDNIEDVKVILVKAMDSMFGEDAFDKIYKMTPSVIVVADYYKQMTTGVIDELNKRGMGLNEDAIAEEYLIKE